MGSSWSGGRKHKIEWWVWACYIVGIAAYIYAILQP
jgi:hypothetical protein